MPRGRGPTPAFFQSLPVSSRRCALWCKPPDPSPTRTLQTELCAFTTMVSVVCARTPDVLCGGRPGHVAKTRVLVKLRTTYGAPMDSFLHVLWDDFGITFCQFVDQILCSFWTIFCTPSLITMDLMTTTFSPIFWTTFWTTICMTFCSFFRSSCNAFWSFLGPNMRLALVALLATLLPTTVPRLVVPWVVIPVHAAVRRVVLWALELARGPDM